MSAPCPILCFVVTVGLRSETTPSDAIRLVESLNDLLDQHGLTTLPQGTEAAREYLIRREGSQATNDDRSLVQHWASHWNATAMVDVGDIIDLSHGD